MIEKKVTLSAKKRKVYTFVSILLVILIISSVIELTSILILKNKHQKVFPFLVSFLKKEKITGNLNLRYNYLDPHLGYSHNNEMMRKLDHSYSLDGFAVYRNKTEKAKNVIKIIILGGSTTDPIVRNSWPKQLNDVVNEKGVNFELEILNGGVAGYSSNQELLKMLRDCLPLKPDIIICMDGINEVGNSHSLKSHPMVERYQEEIFQHIAQSELKPSPLFPNTISLLKSVLIKEPEIIKGINYGPVVDTTAWDQWERNIKIMNVVAKEFSIEYFCFLQPILGFGEYVPTPEENKMLMTTFGEGYKGYLGVVKDFYSKAQETCKRLPYCIDITGCFAKMSGMYKDPRHPNEQGYRIMAELVFKELEERSIIIKKLLKK